MLIANSPGALLSNGKPFIRASSLEKQIHFWKHINRYYNTECRTSKINLLDAFGKCIEVKRLQLHDHASDFEYQHLILLFVVLGRA